MLIKSLSTFCKRNKKYQQRFSPPEEHDKLKPDRILEILCEFFMQPECTKDVAECFPQLLPVLISLAIFTDDVQSPTLVHNDLVHRLNCVILGKLVDINPDLLVFVLRYFDTNPAPFEPLDTNDSSTYTSTPPKRRNNRYLSYNIVEVSEYDIVAASYSILQSSINHFKHKWNWSTLYKYLTSADDKIKWITINCMAIILNLHESAKLSCAQIFIPNFEQFPTDYDDTSTNVGTCYENVESMEEAIKNVPSVVCVGDILLPACGKSQKTHNLVAVPSTTKNLQRLAIAIGARKCICLQGPVGCGKTALVEYLAGITGHDTSNFVKIQLGDQTDSKMLLGMYKCTDMPGEFVWQPGVLTQAVIAGKWLLLEDVDSAPLDVISVLSNLMETGTLCVPGYRDTVYANSGFQLFVTQRLTVTTTGVQKHMGSSSLLQKHWLCLNVEPLSKNELVTVVRTLFPVLSTIANRIVDVFLLFSARNYDNNNFTSDNTLSLRIERQISTRDLMKWCSRAIINFNVSSPTCLLKIFQDALDIFCYSIPGKKYRLKLAEKMTNILGIIEDKAEYFCNVRKPDIALSSEVLKAGRAQLLCKKAQYATMIKRKTTKFSDTQSSSCLLECIAGCVTQKEPVLLVGETGTGKTSAIQYLADSTGYKLIVINMNQQSESTDLLGGYKPIDLKFLISPFREEFEVLFRSLFDVASNEKYLETIAMLYEQHKWNLLISTMSCSIAAALKRLRKKRNEYLASERPQQQERIQRNLNNLNKWMKIQETLKKLKILVKNQYMLAFSFIEGSLVKAIREGYWVLFDEINLANAETLECLSGLLEGSSSSLALLERGDREPVNRHPDFRIFACMNPATDVGKRDLPVGLRNRFTEFYVNEMTDPQDLLLIVKSYLENLNLPVQKHKAIVQFYLNVRNKAMDTLYDGTAHSPHYSLRTLCRALYISASNPCGNVLRSLYEAFSLSFLTQLDYKSYPIVQEMIMSTILGNKNAKAVLNHSISKPKYRSEDHISIERYWILQGSLTPKIPSNYVLTDTVRRNLRDLVRVVSIGKIPVLLQGDTSVGKTSLIKYLAEATGHVCLRINNHEHTDLQEYVGSYVSDEHGRLVFKEGILVDAMRKGYWIILDELNLAPSDVLEALNRVLDDNRELFIPEMQQVVKAHEHFMLFATQNPAGLYGGRKILSRAFKNRFVELHFDEIPPNELEIILAETCQMPKSYCKRIIKVMTDLQTKRRSTAAFVGKKGFITLRDLFRWGRRYALAPNVSGFYDWNQHLADEGYLVLAAKIRKAEETDEVRQAIKKHMKRDVDPDNLFTLNDKTSLVTKHILEEILNNDIPGFGHIVWTYHMRRMAVLMKKSCEFKEPVLLVGETGGGKTTICQLIAAMNKQTMRSINCHMHTESSDFLGNLRPVREHAENDQKLFEWVDGPLIDAMRNGDLFLADEISLADDSVLERLNSLLESERSLLLAERGIESSHSENIVIKADEKFMFIGTMNPGGDYGKKELSPALRNRFTEVWCEGCTTRSDLHDIIIHNLNVDSQTTRDSVARAILRFTEWLHTTDVGKKLTVSIRDVLTWVEFINTCTSDALMSRLTIGEAYYHGACLTYIDSLGSGCTGSEHINQLNVFVQAAIRFVKSEVRDTIKSDLGPETFETNGKAIVDNADVFGVPPFYIKKGPNAFAQNEDYAFTFTTPTTKLNTLKLLRGLQLSKPILLEGSPGVGKTSLVSALAKAAGHTLLRINLSDQTDISDLFGTDLPVEGGKGGEFAWRDGPFLRALRAGYWILLDELNLASQSVLEGLNACFDHRGEVYIPELARTFSVKPGTRLFACQNPLRQGGARRGLPKSFLNRFTQVFVNALVEDDLKLILNVQFPQLPTNLLNDMVRFNNRLASEAGVVWGHAGSPWEMNLRDITRWCEATIEAVRELRGNEQYFNPGDCVELVYVNRMRTVEDRQKIYDIYQEIFLSEKYPLPPKQLPMHITADKLFIGDVTLSRENCSTYEDCNLLVLRDQKMTLKSLMQCVKMNCMSILIGASGCGKSNVVRLLAALTGQKLKSIGMNSAMDTTEILGGFEQTDYNRHLEQLLNRVTSLVITSLRTKLTENLEQVSKLHEDLEQVRRLFDENVAGIIMDVQLNQFLNKINKLSELVSKMKLCEPCHESELLDIESDLKKLSDLVKQDKCLNAGGKFEWVDSVLVKCLQDGTWLLIDQVNLCSPAVLDRLNGLLEPNGVLTIGERGVNGEGNVVTIKPHKNFRLFLTMDPRYGEISRAMRNRGVEIYMLGAKENIDYDAIDLQSLLFNAGIARSAQRAALLDIYKRVSTEIVTVDRLGAVDLLHTAFLVKQRTLRGFPTGQSIRDACIDVYVKTRPMSDRVFKEERLIALIDEAIEQHVARDEQQASMIDLDAATWSVSNLQKNLRLIIIRQQGLLLNAAVKIHVSRSKLGSGSSGRDIATTKLLNDFCNLEENEEFALVIDIVDALPHLLLNFFEQSSQGDVQLRKRWISKMLRQNAIFGNFERKIELMAKVIASFRFRNSPLPWNLWQLVGRKITCHENDSVCSDANKLLLLLYAYNMVLNNDVIPTENEILEDKNIMSVKQYSAIIHKGTLFSRLKNQPLITYFVEFIERASSCIGAILQVYDVTANSEEYVELRKDLMWYARFVQLGEMTLINKSEKSKDVFINLEQISLLLRVHYKWLLKFLRRLFTIVERSSRDAIPLEVGRLVDLVDDLNGQLGSVYDPIKKISKRIKKHLTLPPPHSSETCMNVHSGLRRITQKLDARDKSGNILREEWRIVAVQLDDALAMRHRAISLWREIHSGSPIDTTTWQTILEMEQLCESYTCLRSSGNNESVLSRVKSLLSEAKMTQLNMKTQLWPIYEYVFLSLACTLQGEMCRSGIISTAECLARFADLPSIPSDLMSLLDTMARTEVEQKQKLALLPELFRRLAQFAQQSYAVKDTSRLLQWHGITAEEDEGMSECVYTESKMECYFGGPVLFNLMLQLMLNKTSQEKEKKVSSAVALGTYAKKMDQLQLLNEILWRNSISLTSKRYDLSSSDLITLKFYLRLYMSAIDKMNIEYNVRDLIAIAMKKQGTRAVDIEHKLQIDYFQPLEDLHRACDEINTIDEENAGEEENILHRGRTWMSLGYIQLLLFGNLDLIDPVHKVELKLKYLEQDIVDCKRTMYVATLQNRILGMSAEDEYAHPKLAATRNCELRLLKTRDDLNYLKAFRPSSVNFASLSEESANFRNEVASYKLVEKHASSLCAIARKIRQNCDSADLIAAEITSREAESWSLSVQQFAEQIEAKYLSAYPDVIIPLMTALAQLRHGVCILINEIRRLTSLRKSTVANLEFLIHNLLRFPTIGQQQDSLLTLSGLCASTSARELISENLRSADTFVRMREQFRIFKSGLHEMHNHVILNRGLTKSLWWNINELLQQIVLIWKQQQQEEERRAAERDSLYKNKIKSHAPAEEDDELALIHKMFPKHDAKDFDDIENTMPSLNGNGNVSVEMDTSDETELSLSGLITKDDMKEIQQIHSNIVTSFIASKWMCNSPVSMCSTDYIGPLIQRYNTVHGMIKDILPSLSEGLATRLYNSFNLLVTLELQANQDKSVNQQTLWENAGRQTTKAYNFYNDCNIEEVKQCLPVCQSILSRVDELLKEWPENPILRSIRCIIERIYTFPTISPVSRFLTGLELLLEKMHQWEEFAHSGVRMVDHISALTQQIISWRKLELSCWKACLDTVYEDLRSDTSKWWFFLYALIESYVTKSACNDTEIARANDEQPITRQELVESLEHFMTESSLVEFEARLNLLLTFHCHVYYLDDNDDKNEISAVLWNMYSYYKQFVDDVKTQIAALKAPIEKKLKDIIKIVRWTGTNHWAVRKSAEATHRQLHKYVKEFQNALKQSVSTCLIVKSGSYSMEMSKGVWDDQDHRDSYNAISPDNFIVTKSPHSSETKALSTNRFITRTETLLVKAKKLCKEIILGNSYSCIRSELEDFVQDFMEQSARLRNTDIDKNLPKGKQKSQAKSILQQKRMTLGNYFKMLTQMGVSYRAGGLMLKNNADKVTDFTVPSLDLSTIDRYFNLRNIDQHMLKHWQGCEKYYYKSLVRLNALNAMLSTNHTDLGLQNIERCRGYSAHLMLMAHRQKRTIAQSFDRFSSLRIQLANLSESCEQDLTTSKQREGQNCAENLKTLLITIEAGFEQLLLFLQCCPADSSTDPGRAMLTLHANALPITAASQNDEAWKNANALVKDGLNSIKAVAKRYHVLFMPFQVLSGDGSVYASILSSRHFKFLEQSCATIENLRARCKELKRLFTNTDIEHPIWENIAFFDMKMECSLRDFERLRESAEVDNEERSKATNNAIEQYELALEQFINTILLVIQKKYKDRINMNDDATHTNENSKEKNNEDDVEKEMQENVLKEKLVDSLEKDITELKLSTISDSFFNLLLSIRELDLQSANYCTGLLLKCLPLLEQYMLLSQFYLNEQVAAFRVTCKMLYLQLNVFLDLAANGFCVPKHLDLEEGETDESGEKTEKGGMGLADGEGTKDVSDRIESEDQLEDAKLADQEQEKQEDKTCKEEEKGIDMSEDFDSKLQDLEKGNKDEEEQSDDDDEEDDLDKEMGETGEGAEQLDKEIWGDDKEESDDDNQPENEDEKEGKGEQTGEKELTAKDDTDRKRQHDDDDTDENQQEDSKKEINELNEPEVNEDQVDPYYGNFQPQPEPEPFDLPEDLNLDENEEENNDGPQEENPFDIDEMKDSKPPPQEKDAKLDEETDDDKENDSGKEDEDEDGENMDKNGQNTKDDVEANKENEENNGNNAETGENEEDEKQNQEETEEEKLHEEATPSANDASQQMDAQAVEKTTEGSRDAVAQEQNDDNQQQQDASTENTQENSNDNGIGQSESVQQESGHTGSSKQEIISGPQRNITQPMKKNKPSRSNEDRTLLDRYEPLPKKLKTVYTQEEVSRSEKEDDLGSHSNEAEMAQHIHKDSQKFDDYTLDAATEDQLKQQASNEDKENEKEEKEDDCMDVEMHEDEQTDTTNDKVTEQKPEKVSEANERQKDTSAEKRIGNDVEMETPIEFEGEETKMPWVQRGNECIFNTMECNLEQDDLTSNYVESKRSELEKILSEWTQIPSTEEAAAAWNDLCSITDAAARDLSEKLRLILEPTQASRLKGDYKTGKRINMRKIIPYIASQFRKDKIWLRRTKPSKRDYQIIIAVDDSSSVSNNKSKEMIFESLALISKAMTYLEVGQLGVFNFGSTIKLLHPLGETFTEQTGNRIMQEMTYDQKETLYSEAVNFAMGMFENQRGSSDNAKLMIILSDGMGVNSEGKGIIQSVVKRARMQDIFLIFIIAENPNGKFSVLDYYTTRLEESGLVMEPYMDSFPFPFYVILRDTNALPSVLSDALRQWFEIVGKIDS
ncbi:hypothetical protein DMN91_003993 [Ooceraea biroi]|uniref:Midasin n=1 Tax=Ooceraea biroi TaxID=2015173 RepID=A0A3L8DTL1_OOCBI|nr:midasin [Ooceraea biroi]RLU23785.1 hypothetical protein DMN91_003993 [Ooceraea biroi]